MQRSTRTGTEVVPIVPPSLTALDSIPLQLTEQMCQEFLEYRGTTVESIPQRTSFTSRSEALSTFDIVSWWTSKAAQWPHLTQLAMNLLHIPTSTAEVERTFSGLGRILTESRRNMSDDLLNDITSVYWNLPRL